MSRYNACASPSRPSACRSVAFAAALLATALAAAPVLAGGPVRDLATCQRLAETAPAQALFETREWLAQGGAREAKLCRAAALFHSGDFAAAGQAFEELVTAGAGESDRQIANLLDRAAWAWVRAGDTVRADQLYTKALARLPDDGELRIDRGIARAEGKKYREAIEDFTGVLKRQPRRADAYFYRAAAYRALNDLKNALADVEQSLRLKPGDAEAQVLRGTLRALGGDATGARLDWRDVIKREPESASAKEAAENLTRLDQAQAKGGQGKAKP